MTKLLLKFDAAATLRSSEAVAEYVAAALETQDAGYVSHALGTVARARGMDQKNLLAGTNTMDADIPTSTGRASPDKKPGRCHDC